MKINGIIGKKLGMSLIYDDNGNMLPVTLVQAGPCTVTQVKTLAKDGYDSVQIGFSESKNLNSPQSGHQKRSGGQFSVLQIMNISIGKPIHCLPHYQVVFE